VTIAIRPAHLEDFEVIYDLFQHILDDGTTYSYTPAEMTPERSLAYWMTAPDTHAHIAEIEGEFAGCYALRRNRSGRANHVANASFIVHPDYRRRGVGRALGEHMLAQAKGRGYQAVQYNFVVSANAVAVGLWKSLGFIVNGTMPKGFQHATLGLVDVYMMHRFL
jgi:GNAT superfamily N-acetyltransferase